MAANPYERIRDELNRAEQATPAHSLTHLRSVLDEVSALLDENMARAVVEEGASIRSVGASAGLTENAVGPRLARTQYLASYASPNGRVTAADVHRARYDRETGSKKPFDQPKPLRFKPRRNT
ncbi:hypothetical protein FOS14_22000 [Skermania sp. ID1734]|uniref:hypothetical protein n=1 Tax=Skermania sp. ID1734 TaxID=2597516 RepID=UPI00118076E6|nr:hypothetical protein [Skermania sp. ID1734]TSD93951.1 hypothetical protein FOS14_22000 [Skermania sp. ID1734]